jgi:hypothetical protein
MEDFNIKTLLYFVIAILWLIFNAFKKKPEKKQQPVQKAEQQAPRQFKDQRKKAKVIVEQEPFLHEELRSQRKPIRDYIIEETEKPIALAENTQSTGLQFDQDELKKMVIYSELLKRPVY